MKTITDLIEKLDYSITQERSYIHLQWFAAEDEGRTEDPTEQKIRKAREEGRVAKSSEMTSAISLLFTVVGLALMGNYILNKTADIFTTYFTAASNPSIIDSGRTLLIHCIEDFLYLVAPIFIIALLAGFVGNVIQTGFLFSLKPIQPDLKRIAPNFTRWLSRSFGWPEGAFNFFKSITKIAVITAIAIVITKADISKLAQTPNATISQSIHLISFIAFKIMISATIILLAFALLDFLFQRRQHREALKMTKQEVKEEYKQTEGDPQIKGRIRSRMRELLSMNLNQVIPEADVIITNPTHFAVALQWDNATMVAPMVTAKGADENAFRIRRIAEEHNITIMENKPLARGLYDNVEIGDIIPEKYWEVVSRILAEVYRLKENRYE